MSMRRFVAIAAIGLAAVFGADSVLAQARVINRAPRTQKPPIMMVIPPSAALKAAMGMTPGAKPIAVTRRGNDYIIKLKQGNTVIKRVVSGDGSVLR